MPSTSTSSSASGLRGLGVALLPALEAGEGIGLVGLAWQITISGCVERRRPVGGTVPSALRAGGEGMAGATEPARPRGAVGSVGAARRSGMRRFDGCTRGGSPGCLA